MNRRWLFILLSTCCLWAAGSGIALAQDGTDGPTAANLDLREMFEAGGVIGIVILALSVAMVALIVEHLFSIRRNALMPRGLAANVHDLIQNQQFQPAIEHCQQNSSFLAHVLASGLSEIGLGYAAVEKAMEDASTQQAARLFRKIEYLSVIGTIAPMLGLLGTVWGMMLAFLELTLKASPQPSDLAPGIYKALVTTLVGLGVAVPALTSFAIFRNRIDELVAETSLMAEHVFLDYKRALAAQRQTKKARTRAGDTVQTTQPVTGIRPIAAEREPSE